MFVTYVVVTIAAVLANGAVAVADLRRMPAAVENAATVGVPRSWVVPLGLPKVAAVGGLLLGLAGLRWLGVAAAAGLVVFFACAVAVHVHKRVFRTLAFPLAFFALAVASLVTGVAVAG